MRMDENFSRLNAAEAALVQALRSAALRTAEECGKELPEALSFELERPRRADQGDRASNVAMQLARAFSMPPRDIAARIAGSLQEGCRDLLDRVEVAGPGFINLFLSPRWFAEAASQVLQQGERYGAVDMGHGRKVQVEFVSANPTGPLHIGHGRGAAVGDAVARILSFTGWNVEREYYLNDAGLQIETLGRSAQARYFEVCGKSELAPLPEDGYKGDYLLELAEQIRKEEGDRFLATPLAESLPWFERYAADQILDGIRKDLERFGVLFDSWFSEASLYERDQVSHAIEDLKERGYAFEANGALWFKSTAFADDKDRVLIRSNGVPTYFASDVAYHHDKFVRRGFDRVIDVWGADHHGYVPRMEAAVEAMGRAPGDFKALLIQLVSLKRDGKLVGMSTRAGEFVTLKEVLDEVGVDATRFFFLMRRSDSQLDFDLSLAKKQSNDNPVYYLQYAHARISSILREWEGRGGDAAELRRDGTPLPDLLFDNKDARALAETLAVFPVEMAGASVDLAPHMVAAYALNLAGAFHSFYNTNRILGESTEVERGRLRLAEAVRIVLATCLGLLGVSAPERM